MAAVPNSPALIIPQRIERNRVAEGFASAIQPQLIRTVNHGCLPRRASGFLAGTDRGDRISTALGFVTTGYHSVKIRKFSPLGGMGGTLR